jgi:hypothetical protein|tara:strand:- start:121 stop:489 length:369 start_codon:yes stop_codon:yes gene_type:complete
MTSKYYELFNNKLDEFIKELIITFPTDPDFKLFQASFRLLKIANDTKPLELFYAGLTDDYKKNIKTHNEKFFLENDYDHDEHVSDKLISKLKKYWSDFNTDNKNTVWQYFTILLKICEKHFE